jgi:hypothetical protein
MIVYGPKRIRCSRQAIGRRGRRWYEQIRSAVEGEHHGKVIAIDVGTGEFEIDKISKDGISGLSQRLYDRVPDAEIWFARIGFDGVERSRKIREEGFSSFELTEFD